MLRAVRVPVVCVVLAFGVLSVMARPADADAWRFVYRSASGRQYTYPTNYASKTETLSAFRAWRNDRYRYDRKKPQLVGTRYYPNATPDRHRHPY